MLENAPTNAISGDVLRRGFGHDRGERVLEAAAWAAAILIVGVLGLILADLVRGGWSELSIAFLVDAPRNAGRAGGIGPILVSTLWILIVCLAVAVPLGVGTAVLLAETAAAEGVFGRLVRRSLDVLAGVPSIVFGLFGNAFFCIVLGLGFSILSGGLTLACMVLPLLIRTSEEGIRSVPQEIRLAAAALGLTRARALFAVILPAAVPALLAGLVLSVGRALAETAALIFTSGYVDRRPESLFDSGRSLSIHIYDLAMNVAGGEANAHATALVLVGLLLLINGSAAWLGERVLARRMGG